MYSTVGIPVLYSVMVASMVPSYVHMYILLRAQLTGTYFLASMSGEKQYRRPSSPNFHLDPSERIRHPSSLLFVL